VNQGTPMFLQQLIVLEITQVPGELFLFDKWTKPNTLESCMNNQFTKTRNGFSFSNAKVIISMADCLSSSLCSRDSLLI